MLIVHHTRKLQSEDCFDMISGTNGLLGAADGARSYFKKQSELITRAYLILLDVTNKTKKFIWSLIEKNACGSLSKWKQNCAKNRLTQS